MDPCWAVPPVPGAGPGASSSPSAWSAAWGGGRRAYGACHGDLRALPCRMLEAASLSSTGAAACTACHARCSSIAPLVEYVSAHRGHFVGSVAPPAGGSGTDFRMAPSVAGSKGRLASGTVCGASAPPGAATSRAGVAGAGPRLRMASRCASACSHVCQCVEPIWRSGLPLHRRSWKACSQWYTVVGTSSWSSRSAGCAAAGHTPGLAARALFFSLTWSRRAWCSPSCSALTIMRVQSATRTTASGPGRRSGSQTTMCASAGLNMQTTHCGFCCPRWATARVAAGRACVIGPAWRSGTSVALMVSPCHTARRCSSWSGLHTSAGV